MTRSTLRRVLTPVVAVVLLLLLIGITYQGVITALERRRFPYPGRLVDIGGHQLHLYCVGEGRPTVVLEAPAAGMSAAWGWVQPELANTTRVCSYDRSGLGWSQAGEARYDLDAVADQLRTLLERSGEPGPYVIAGHGLGAVFARMYSSRHADQTASVVLIDPPPVGAAPSAESARLLMMAPWLARLGGLRISRLLSGRTDGLPEPARGELAAFLNRPDHLARAALEVEDEDLTREETAAVPVPDGVPVWRVSVIGVDGVAFLTSEEQAAPVVTAVRSAITAFRESQ